MSEELFLGRGRVDDTLVQQFIEFAHSPKFRPPPVPRTLAERLQAPPEAIEGWAGLLSEVESSVYRGHQCERLFQAYWRHSVAVAAASELVSAALPQHRPEAFVLGLLHDVGRPVALNALLAERHHVPALARVTESVLSLLVDEVHAIVGGVTAARWGLGRTFVQVIGGHHDEALLDKDAREAAHIVTAGDAVSAEIGCASHAGTTPRVGQLEVLHAMGISSTGTARIIRDSRNAALQLLGV